VARPSVFSVLALLICYDCKWAVHRDRGHSTIESNTQASLMAPNSALKLPSGPRRAVRLALLAIDGLKGRGRRVGALFTVAASALLIPIHNA
jgi:hypothetical protein